MAFVNDDPAKAAGLVANIQKLADANKDKGLKSFVVFMKGKEVRPDIETVAKDKNITIPVTFLPEGAKQGDIKRYNVNPEAKNTVMVYKQGTIQGTWVDVDDEAFEEVEKKTAEVLGE